VRALLLLLAGLAGSATAAEDDYRYPAPARLVVFGDVHGAYDALAKTLRAAKMIDASQHWSGGTATLVSVGDLLDRGPDARKVLDLLMRLEGEARAAGGRVQVLSGNHELMNLDGELRDATSADFAAFAPDETVGERDRAFAIWRARQAGVASSGDSLRADFDRHFPAGWFARRREFAPDGRYGSWLLAHPIAIAVGDTVFVHGGFSRALAGYDLARLNTEFRTGLDAYLKAVSVLETAGWIDFGVSGETRAQAVAARLTAQPATPEASALVAAARIVIDFDAAALFGERGPVWYRGLAMCRAITEQDVADAALAQFGGKRIVVGHTPTPTLRPTFRLQREVLMVDTGMLKSSYGGRGHVVVIDANGMHAIDEDGADVPLVVDDQPIGIRLPGGSDAALEAELLEAQPTSESSTDGDRSEVTLAYRGQALHAWFFPNRKDGDSYMREIAAYRLDRLLGLGLVPVTIAREIKGRPGALQWHPDQLVGAEEAAKGSTRLSPWCETQSQSELLRAWDALLFNQGRTMASVNWEATSTSLLSSDHRRAFGTRPGLPNQPSGHTLQVGAELCRRLTGLNADTLARALTDTISAKEQKALLARRDRLVADAGCAGH
jgi:hypothetical protein